MKTKIGFLIILNFFYLNVFSQNIKYPDQWTLQNSIEYAKTNNFSITSLRLSKNSSDQDLLQAKAAKYPNLNGTVSQGIFAVSGNNGFHINGANSQSIGASSSMILYHDNNINNTVLSKDLLVQMANLSVNEAENNITLSVTQAFLNVMMAQENLIYFQNLLSTTQIQLKQGTQLYNAGSISKLNFLQFQSQQAQDEYNLVAAQNTLRTDLLNLKQLLQLPSSYDFQISAPSDILVSDDIKTLQEVQNSAQTKRPEVKYGQLNIENSETNLKIAQSSIKPTLSLAGNISTNYSQGNGNYFNQLGNQFYLPVGLSLGIPIYNNRIYRTNIEKSKIEIQQANLSLQNTRTVLNQQIEQAFINLQNSISQYESAEKQMKINEETYSIVNAQLKLGAIDYVQLQQQKLIYIQALQNYLQAKYSAVLNKKIYEFYAGQEINL
ncbi:TolC family protein [Kaistella flava (ex Peng et al. 2021)]|uniref:TolC family protein n=1 Tax=Kaistella flava (ex Peng et al. 2021) TaxID=2038776 RepID=A0A7M2Y8J2_9FLAO|nr:TolC family protein [Kaistella flava (ex Peng et al. 2021)]QOW09712.1 TolC family protein [Kaistella flava (ex Peng et al. 2021)]